MPGTHHCNRHSRSAILYAVFGGVISVFLLATLACIVLWWRRRKREQRLPDERDIGTDIEMVCITQVNDGFTRAAFE